MHIMTAEGWKQLFPARFVKPTPGTWNYRGTTLPYNGQFPSASCKRFIAECEQAHEEWIERRKTLIEDERL